MRISDWSSDLCSSDLPTGPSQCLPGVLLNEQNSDSLFVDLLDQLQDFRDEKRRQAESRLVEKQKPRARHKGPPYRHHLLLATRKGRRELSASLQQIGRAHV